MTVPLVIRNVSAGANLSLAPATSEYAFGLDPGLLWRARGVSGYDGNSEERRRLTQEQQRVLAAVSAGMRNSTLESMLTDAIAMLACLDRGGVPADEFMVGRNFVFILGMPRTGGTFLLRELLDHYWQDHRRFYLTMVHDSIPDDLPILRYVANANRVAEPAFQMFQFLAWAKREMVGDHPIVQKRILHAFWLPILDYITGQRANYVVTLRDPVGTFASFLELGGAQVANMTPSRLAEYRHPAEDRWAVYCERFSGVKPVQWRNMNTVERFIEFWKAYYMAVAEAEIPPERLQVVSYGQALADYLVSNHSLPGATRGRFQGRSRTYTVLEKTLEPYAEAIAEAMESVHRVLHLDPTQASALRPV